MPRTPRVVEEHAHGHGAGGHVHDDAGGHGHGHGQGHGSVNFVPSPRGGTRPTLERGAGRGQVLFLDAFSGVAGDMTIAALIDLGVPREVVEQAVEALGISGVELVFRTGHVGALGATHFDVVVRGEQPERSYAQIRALIDAAPLRSEVQTLAQRILLRLAEAECEVHRIALDEVHFHEVGAVDAIVDVVGAAACFEYLSAEVVASPLPMGRGFVSCHHGVLPLPAPATVLCLRGVPTYDAAVESELVTPTGAAIVGAVAERFSRWPSLAPSGVGLGAGTRALADRPNVLRAVLGQPRAGGFAEAATHAVLEANVDDATGELVAHTIARLLSEGALDAWASPVTMKKGRPGLVLSALCRVGEAGKLADTILRETSTLGVRQALVRRVELPRRIVLLETELGKIPVKVAGEPPFKAKPEFDVCARIAGERGLSVRDVLTVATQAAEAWLAEQR